MTILVIAERQKPLGCCYQEASQAALGSSVQNAYTKDNHTSIFSIAFHCFMSMRFIMAFICFIGPHSYHSVIPSFIIDWMESSHKTVLVSCAFMFSTISSGDVPGLTRCAVAFIHTECFGGFMFGSVSSKAAESCS